MFKNLMLAAVVVLAGFGCQSTVNTVENAEVPVPANVVKDKRVITDKFLRDRLEVRLVQETRTDAGNLRVQVTAVNARTGFFSQLWSGLTGEDPYRIDYKFVWLDEQGIAVETMLTGWRTVTVYPGEPVYFTGTSPAGNCSNFILNLKESDQ